MRHHVQLLAVAVSFLFAACAAAPPAAPPPVTWAIALHGGAGVLSVNTPAERLAEYEAALAKALQHGRDRLAAGDNALDVCESVVRMLEDDPHFNAGRGAVFNAEGQHELDASIMDGATLQCGAVTGVRTVKNPVSLARLVMTKTRHVLLSGDGAEQFATTQQVERVPNTWFDTEHRRRALDEVLEEAKRERAQSPDERGARSDSYGTVGCVVRDRYGRLAAATSTGGMTGKRWGRVGDSPLIGAGNYADDTVAVSCTGTGEQFIRNVVAHDVSARMRFARQSVAQATEAIVFGVLRPGDGGLIAVDRDGNLSTPFNSEGMYRGRADSNGRFEVRIFAD